MPLPLLAHAGQFSWDEALLVLAPLVVIGFILVLVNRRVGRLPHAASGDEQADADEAMPTSDDAVAATAPADRDAQAGR